MKTGAGAALIHIDFTAGAREAPATVTAETQRETVLIQLLHTHCTILARITGLTGQELTVMTWSEAKQQTLKDHPADNNLCRNTMVM